MRRAIGKMVPVRRPFLTHPTKDDVAWALAHASFKITFSRGLKPTLRGLMSGASFRNVSLLASTEDGLGRLSCVCIRIVGSGMFLLPLPTGCVTFGEDMSVGRGPG